MKRGLYISGKGIQINADINEPAHRDILRKAYQSTPNGAQSVPKQKQWRIGVVDAPVCISYF